MNVTVVVLVAIVIIVLVALAIWYFTQQQRREKALREQFGPEYDHAVATYGERRSAEEALEDRAERVAALHIRPLQPEESRSFGEQWHQVQTDFVDDPEGAIRRADALCGEVMRTRGYPMGNFEQRAADVSVDHASVVENYRAAHALAQKAQRGEATTENLRQAMVHYRTLFEDLIDAREAARMERR